MVGVTSKDLDEAIFRFSFGFLVYGVFTSKKVKLGKLFVLQVGNVSLS